MCLEVYDKKGNLIASYHSISFEGMTEDEIFASGAFKDPEKAKKLYNELKLIGSDNEV